MKVLFALFAALVAHPALARDPLLGLPLDCTLGDTCFILQYVDADPGPGAADFTCQTLSYDGHKGTDFALPSFAAMDAGVNVIASSPGVVRGVRNSMPDLGADDTPPDQLQGQECGNGVVIDHGANWETQYCHLKQGSVTVRPGQRVGMGTVLGQVGYSGMTQFPHVHIAVRHEGRVVDPFNTDEIVTCGRDDGPEDDLWASLTPYGGSTLVSSGITDHVPTFEDVKAGTAGRLTLSSDAPAIVGWSMASGVVPGDQLEIQIVQPGGEVLAQKSIELDRKQAMVFRAYGKKRPTDGWITGTYTMSARLIRDGEVRGVQITRLTVE